MHQKRLAAGLRPDPLGEFKRSPRLPSLGDVAAKRSTRSGYFPIVGFDHKSHHASGHEVMWERRNKMETGNLRPTKQIMSGDGGGKGQKTDVVVSFGQHYFAHC